jgi:hypothetical protein
LVLMRKVLTVIVPGPVPLVSVILAAPSETVTMRAAVPEPAKAAVVKPAPARTTPPVEVRAPVRAFNVTVPAVAPRITVPKFKSRELLSVMGRLIFARLIPGAVAAWARSCAVSDASAAKPRSDIRIAKRFVIRTAIRKVCS